MSENQQPTLSGRFSFEQNLDPVGREVILIILM